MSRITLTLLTAIVLLASCNQYEKTPSGFAYKIHKGNSKELLKQGQFVKLNLEYKLPAKKDSVLSSSFGRIPVYFVVDTTRVGKHSFIEIITKCAPGDKVDFIMSVDSLKKLGMVEYNDIFKQKDVINGKVEIIKTFASQELMMADYQKEMEIEKNREIKELKDFTAKKGAKVQETGSGVLVEITNAGDQTLKADTGKQVSLLYRGTFLDGKKFDGNMDKDAQNNQPLNFVINSGSVIRGMDEGVRLFGKGGRGKLYIPALLGYGPNGSAPVIPPYASLVFDIEVLDVTVPTANPAKPGAPQTAAPAEAPDRK